MKFLVSKIIITGFIAITYATVFSQQGVEKRPRVVITEPDFIKTSPSPTPRKVSPTLTIQGSRREDENSGKYRELSLEMIKGKIAEAKLLLQSKPLLTSLTDSSQIDTNWIRLAFFDRKEERIDFVVLPKALFLQKGAQIPVSISNNRLVNVSIIRANGVNTPVTIWEDGIFHLPLLVQYPIEKEGKHRETAYYVSTHPGLVTPEVIEAGKLYIRNIVDAARYSLRQKGILIQKEIADIAERLMVVEQVDHYRFRTEPHINIFNDIYAIYALNEGQAYRYAVSRAGAGELFK